MSEVEGLYERRLQDGSVGVVLVKYTGGQNASPGYELVTAGLWK